MLKKYSAFLDRVDRVLIALLAAFSAIMVLVMLYQIVLRYCFSSANVWAEELTRFIFVWVTTLGASVAIRRNVHLRVDLVVDFLKPRPRFILQIITYTLILLFLIYLFQLGVDLMSRTMINKSAGLRLPMAYPYAAIPVGAAFMILSCIEFIAKKFEELRALNEHQPGEPS
ncbi:MAG: TRAP transporter small permease [Deltaproteobacteria bacterium]|jgi:TRAP-type C4-dicarboxylate transport system permease small subunit|nr:TRAP transporter small permease [Deltaproteobacteria bacterium]